MPNALFVLLLLVAVVSRPIEARLWRAGRISDRVATVLLLGRFPALVFLGGWFVGSSHDLPLVLGLTAVSALPAALLYRYVLHLLQEQARERTAT